MLIQEDYFRNIFNTVREAILILDENMRVLSANRSFFKIFKVDSANTIGSLLYDLGNGQWNIQYLRVLLEDILPKNDTVDDYEIEHAFESIGHKIMLLNACKIRERNNDLPIILLAIEDITERREIEKGMEKARKELAVTKIAEDEAREYAESIINTVREPLIALDQDLRVVTANRSFYEVFKVNPKETVGQLIYDLGNKQWDIPNLRELLETILPEKTTFDNYEVEHEFTTIGRRIMLLNARQIHRVWGKELIILLAIEDITERKRLEDFLIESEKRYRRVFETASDGIVLLEKREGHITHVNPATEKMLGYSKEECIGKKLQDIGVPLDMSNFPMIMQTLDKNGILNYEDVPVKPKSGPDVDTDIYMVDRAREAQCNIRDITERKIADKIFKEEKIFIETALNTLKDVFFVFDLEGKFLRWNKAMSAVTGYMDTEIASMKSVDFFRDDDKERISEAIQRVAKEGNVTVEALFFTKDGRPMPHEFTASLLRDHKGNSIGITGVGRDITERKQLEEKLREYAEDLEVKVGERTRELEDANIELQTLNNELVLRRQEADDAKARADEANRAKSDFLANMSHELRTPLNSIIGFSEILEDGIAGPMADNQKELINDVSTSGKHLLSLINDILDLAKVEAGKMELEPGEFKVEEMIEGSLVMFKEKAMKHNIKAAAAVETGIDNIIADERKIKQILFNLLSNAFKFTPDGGSVSIVARKIGSSEVRKGEVLETSALPRFRADRDFIEISVTDTGIGVSPEDQKKLFQPFQQIDSAQSRKYSGTGLGLNLCKKFVELHGGRIWMESEVGKGSRFVFVIPARQTT